MLRVTEVLATSWLNVTGAGQEPTSGEVVGVQTKLIVTALRYHPAWFFGCLLVIAALIVGLVCQVTVWSVNVDAWLMLRAPSSAALSAIDATTVPSADIPEMPTV